MGCSEASCCSLAKQTRGEKPKFYLLQITSSLAGPRHLADRQQSTPLATELQLLTIRWLRFSSNIEVGGYHNECDGIRWNQILSFGGWVASICIDLKAGANLGSAPLHGFRNWPDSFFGFLSCLLTGTIVRSAFAESPEFLRSREPMSAASVTHLSFFLEFPQD